MHEILLIASFFLVALIYSSTGLGGGSSYLALLALSGLAFVDFRMIALLCNIVVVAGSVFWHFRAGLLRFPKVLPLVLLSVPLAYLGGMLALTEAIYFILLAVFLLVAGALMLFPADRKVRGISAFPTASIGGGIGFISGVVGIGGGIFLSPILHLSNWQRAKVIAATTSFFILVNSIAGLLGQIYRHGWSLSARDIAPLLLAVLIGGSIGVNLTIRWLTPSLLKKVTACVVIFVGLRLLYRYLLLGV